MGGRDDDECVAYMSWNGEKAGKIRLNGQPYCKEAKEMFLEEGEKISLTVNYHKKQADFRKSETQSWSVKLPDWFFEKKVFTFVTMTHPGDKVRVD